MDEKIRQSRLSFEELGNNYFSAPGVIKQKEVMDNVECYWFRPTEDVSLSKIVIYLHGGCFVLGSVRSHQALVSHASKYLGLPILFIEYSLAPEKPYPNAVNDISHVYHQLQTRYNQSTFILIGDSTGCWLSMALLSKLTRSGLQAVKYTVMISPWIDLLCSNNSITENSSIDPILNKDRLRELASMFMGSEVLPVNLMETIGDEFPPTLIIVGSREILLDDSKLLYDSISKVQPKTRLTIYDNQTHVWLLDNIDAEPSQNALKEMKSFLNQ